ncbi:MAG: alpha-L-rhamnosidase [Clostridia bacterium]|nr:alpha-L-rhamnosidase [Clostridia bacterium]
MKLGEKFGIYGIDDERARKVIFPTRVVLTNGNVRGAEHLTEYKPAQVAIYGYHDQCVLDNRNADTNAGVLVDFGRELHGTLTVSVWSMNGAYANYTIRLGESVSEAMHAIGVKNATNDHANRDMQTGSGPWASNETNESGFRFAYIELTSPGMFMEIRCITATLIYRDIEYRGSFECSDPVINKIYDTAAYTVHLNMQRYLWDGIKRDRLVWAGDMNTELAAILAVFGENEVVPKSLDLVKNVTPTDASMNGLSSYNLWWLLCHWEWYMGTGNYGYLAQQKEYIQEMLTRYAGYIDENGCEILPEGRFFDWPTNNYPDPKHAGLQGLLRYALLAGGEIMKTLSEPETAAMCYHAADRMLAHRPDPKEWKQPAALLVMGGLLDAKEAFDKCISVGGAQGLSTFLGYYTLSAIEKAGEYRAALDIMKGYWGTMLEMGATTFWEDFDVNWAKGATPIDQIVPEGGIDIHGDFGNHCYVKLRHSLCHGWASGPAPYLAANVLGIRPLEPGCRTVKFDPHIDGLDWAHGKYPTPYGDIEVEIHKDGGFCKAPDGVNVVME